MRRDSCFFGRFYTFLLGSRGLRCRWNSDKHSPFVEKCFLLASVDPDQWAAAHTVAIPVGDVVVDGWRRMMWSARHGLMDGPSDALEVVRLPGDGRGARGEADREERKKRE